MSRFDAEGTSVPAPAISLRSASPSTGSRDLVRWLKDTGTTYLVAAVALGCHPQWIHRLVHGLAKPSIAMAVKIEALTGIAVAAWVQA